MCQTSISLKKKNNISQIPQLKTTDQWQLTLSLFIYRQAIKWIECDLLPCRSRRNFFFCNKKENDTRKLWDNLMYRFMFVRGWFSLARSLMFPVILLQINAPPELIESRKTNRTGREVRCLFHSDDDETKPQNSKAK